MKAGAKVNFGKAEVFWPQDDKAGDKYQKLLGITAAPKTQDKDLIEPTFDAKVKIDAQIDVLVTPEVSSWKSLWTLLNSFSGFCFLFIAQAQISKTITHSSYAGKHGPQDWR